MALRRALCLALLLPLAAHASGLRLMPLRLDLGAGSTTTQIELSNLEAAPIAVQLKAFRWTQADGRDAYEPTRDIFFAPPIVTVPARGRTTVRFRLRAGVPAQTEAAYRIYFQEVPPAGGEVPAGMAFRLRFGVPLFVAASRPAPAALAIEQKRAGSDLVLALANDGQTHVKIQGVEVFAGEVDRRHPGKPLAQATHSDGGTNYALPQSRHEWRLALPAHAPAPLWLLVRTDDYSGRAAAGITDRGWLWLPVPEAAAAATP